MDPIPAIQSMHRWEAYFSAPEGSSAFQFLYGKDSEALQVERYRRVLCGFAARFGEFPVALISAPGRTELCGNHTDHQHGRVLAAAVSLDLIAAVHPNEGSTMRVCSEGFGEATVSLENLAPCAAECGTSAALVRGVAAALRRAGFRAGGSLMYRREAGFPPPQHLKSCSAQFTTFCSTLAQFPPSNWQKPGKPLKMPTLESPVG